MDDRNFIERVAVQLTIKIGEQICLTEQEARMSEAVAAAKNPQ